MYDTILIPTDGGPTASRVASHVADLAERVDAAVHVLSVADTRNRFKGPTGGVGVAAWEEAQRDRAERAVAETAATLPESVAVTQCIESGVPATAIIEYADAAEVDLIVMGTHGRTGVDHYMIGSIAERIVRTASVPVLTVGVSDAEKESS
jgi:nucleotide-binding universal stress UspA family protein